MVELVVSVTFLAVGAWWYLTREEKVSPPATEVKGPTLLSDDQLTKLTKAKIEELGREHGVELDRRKTKATMIADLKEAVK